MLVVVCLVCSTHHDIFLLALTSLPLLTFLRLTLVQKCRPVLASLPLITIGDLKILNTRCL